MTQAVCGRYHRMTRVPWFGLAHRHFFTTTQNGSNNQVNESTLSLASTPLEIKNVIQNLICEKFSNPPDVWTLQKCCLPHTSNRIHVMMRVQSDSVFGSWGLFGCFKFQFFLNDPNTFSGFLYVYLNLLMDSNTIPDMTNISNPATSSLKIICERTTLNPFKIIS